MNLNCPKTKNKTMSSMKIFLSSYVLDMILNNPDI